MVMSVYLQKQINQDLISFSLYHAVRCLIMQSFLGVDWKKFGTSAKWVHGCFVLSPLIEGINDPVDHKESGLFIFMSLNLQLISLERFTN